MTDEHTPFDMIIAKGIRTGIRLAFFAEQGTVFGRSQGVISLTLA